MLGERWEGDELIGVITIEDFPWLSGSFEALPGFARWKSVFTGSAALLDVLSDSGSRRR